MNKHLLLSLLFLFSSFSLLSRGGYAPVIEKLLADPSVQSTEAAPSIQAIYNRYKACIQAADDVDSPETSAQARQCFADVLKREKDANPKLGIVDAIVEWGLDPENDEIVRQVDQQVHYIVDEVQELLILFENDAKEKDNNGKTKIEITIPLYPESFKQDLSTRVDELHKRFEKRLKRIRDIHSNQESLHSGISPLQKALSNDLHKAKECGDVAAVKQAAELLAATVDKEFNIPISESAKEKLQKKIAELVAEGIIDDK